MAGLRSFFAELDPRIHCLSVDDDVKPQFADEHAKRLQAAVDIGFIPGIRQAAKTGIPQRLRPKLWQRILGVAENCEEADRAYFDRLADAIKEVELVTDDLIRCADWQGGRAFAWIPVLCFHKHRAVHPITKNHRSQGPQTINAKLEKSNNRSANRTPITLDPPLTPNDWTGMTWLAYPTITIFSFLRTSCQSAWG
jgi:hypothetical protein